MGPPPSVEWPMRTRSSYEGAVTARGTRMSLSLGEPDVPALQDRCCVWGFNASGPVQGTIDNR